MSLFEILSKTDVSRHVEKKGKFSYLSWPFAIAELRSADPKATWEIMRFDGKPFLATECGYFVEVAVTVDGVTLSQIHPVLDNYNKPIPKPSSFQINTSIQRCLVKAIALHGLGLYIYAGEDLPEMVAKERNEGPADKQNFLMIKGELRGALNIPDLDGIMRNRKAMIESMPEAGTAEIYKMYEARLSGFESVGGENNGN